VIEAGLSSKEVWAVVQRVLWGVTGGVFVLLIGIGGYLYTEMREDVKGVRQELWMLQREVVKVQSEVERVKVMLWKVDGTGIERYDRR